MDGKPKYSRFQFRLSTAIALVLICGLLMPLVIGGFEESLGRGFWTLGICTALGIILFALWRWIVGMSREINDS